MSAQIKIVLLTDCLAHLMGGAERQIFELAQRLDRGRFTVTIASLESEGEAPRDFIENAGCHLEIFPLTRIYGLSGLLEGLRFFSFLRQRKVDILMTYHFSSDIWGVIWGRLAGVKRIISNRRDMGFWRGWQHILAYRLINRWVDRIVVNSRAIKNKFMKEEHLPEGRFSVIYNGVDPNVTERLVAQSPENRKRAAAILKQVLGIAEDELVIMHVANLREVKGHRYLIEAFAGIVAEFPRAKIVLIGEGKLKQALLDLALRLKLYDHVLFLGPREDVCDLLPIADICVMPSLSEGMSNAILEYMACGKPVIATNVGGNPELVQDGFNGILVPAADSQQLAEALATLLRDENKRASMGENSLKKIRDFEMDKMIGAYENVFLELAKP